jgi:hypothetical protein
LIKQKSEKRASSEAIADAFDSLGKTYCDDWIEVTDWLRIICTEYDIIPAIVDVTAIECNVLDFRNTLD